MVRSVSHKIFHVDGTAVYTTGYEDGQASKSICSEIDVSTTRDVVGPTKQSIDFRGYTSIDIEVVANFNNSYSITIDGSTVASGPTVASGTYDISNASNITLRCKYDGHSDPSPG